MSSVAKLTRRFLAIFAISTILLLIVNIILLTAFTLSQSPNSGPWTTAEETATALNKTSKGYILAEKMSQTLQDENAWAIFIDNNTLKVTWHTENLPKEIPLQYTISDISSLTRGYISDYPSFTAGKGDGLIVVGFPKDSYWKHLYPSWDYDTIKNSPYIVLSALGINIIVIFLIYVIANSRLLHSVKPIVSGIQTLPTMKPVYIRQKGLLSDLAGAINQTSEILLVQQTDLKKKETARANWISGISHDIRTPLSMVLGYAGQMEEDFSLSEENRKKASIIRRQSLKIKNLINDLNLSSKLEYHMQPLRMESVNLAAVIRQCAADLLNYDLDGKYLLEWTVPDPQVSCVIHGDKNLLHRAVSNLLNNAQFHNPDGCHISLELKCCKDFFCITVKDDGIGISTEKLNKLNNTPHYMMNDRSTDEPRHGLGLLIVQQIISAHHGKTVFSSVNPHGFEVDLILPGSDSSSFSG